jgi:hypothetical protein
MDLEKLCALKPRKASPPRLVGLVDPITAATRRSGERRPAERWGVLARYRQRWFKLVGGDARAASSG